MKKNQITLKVNGMHCESCAKMIELDLEDEGIKATCNYVSCELKINDNPKGIEKAKIGEILKKSGYSIT